MHPKTRQLWDFMKELSEHDEKIPIQDALIMIGILKIAQTSLMLRAKGDLFPEEEKKQ